MVTLSVNGYRLPDANMKVCLGSKKEINEVTKEIDQKFWGRQLVQMLQPPPMGDSQRQILPVTGSHLGLGAGLSGCPL